MRRLQSPDPVHPRPRDLARYDRRVIVPGEVPARVRIVAVVDALRSHARGEQALCVAQVAR